MREKRGKKRKKWREVTGRKRHRKTKLRRGGREKRNGRGRRWRRMKSRKGEESKKKGGNMKEDKRKQMKAPEEEATCIRIRGKKIREMNQSKN